MQEGVINGTCAELCFKFNSLFNSSRTTGSIITMLVRRGCYAVDLRQTSASACWLIQASSFAFARYTNEKLGPKGLGKPMFALLELIFFQHRTPGDH